MDSLKFERTEWGKEPTREFLLNGVKVHYDACRSQGTVIDQETGKGDSWVEWSYVINLKENTLTVYGHIDYPPIKSYDLNALPSDEEFVNELEKSEA